jgi:hypothetical protein
MTDSIDPLRFSPLCSTGGGCMDAPEAREANEGRVN